MPHQSALPLSNELHAGLLKVIPHLRAFAISLCGNVDQSDDLVQEAILRGLTHLDSFEPGSNLQAWLFTISAESVPYLLPQAPPRDRGPGWTPRGQALHPAGAVRPPRSC